MVDCESPQQKPAESPGLFGGLQMHETQKEWRGADVLGEILCHVKQHLWILIKTRTRTYSNAMQCSERMVI